MVVDLVDGKAKIAGKVQAGYVYVDGLSVGDVTETSPQGPPDPRRRGHHLGLRGGGLAPPARSSGGPHIQARGSGIEDAAFAAVIPKIDGGPGQVGPGRRRRSRTSCSSSSAARVGKWVSDTYRRRPMILPVVVEV